MKQIFGNRARHFYRFGSFRLYVAERELFKNGELVTLPPKTFDVLFLLVSHQGHVVDKDELMKTVWPDTFVEEASLVYQVSQLRKALGKTLDGKSYLETIAKRGYRFAASVTESWEDDAQAEPSTVRFHEEAAKSAGRLPRIGWRLAGIFILAILALPSWLWILGPWLSPSEPAMRSVPLSSLRGVEGYPAISPDGSFVAFAHRSPDFSKDYDLFISRVGGESILRQLTDSHGQEHSPTWAPDGSEIAFWYNPRKADRTNACIKVVDVFGASERTLMELLNSPRVYHLHQRVLDWSPNGKQLAFVDRSTPEEPESMFMLSIGSGERRRLTSPPAQSFGDWDPAFSPDGRSLAFVRLAPGPKEYPGVPHICLLHLAEDGTPDGEPVVLFSGHIVVGLDWTADGRSIVFSSFQEGTGHLWVVSATGSQPRRLNLGDDAYLPSISLAGDRLVYSRVFRDTDIWRTLGPGANETAASAQENARRALISSTRQDQAPRYSPHGEKIAFESGRMGDWRLFVSKSDGSHPKLLVDIHGSDAAWAPDGQKIAFSSNENGNRDIYVIGEEGGPNRRLTFDAAADSKPNWSNHSSWVYFGSNRSEDWQVWKIPSAGGTAEQITKSGGYEAFESADGKFLYYAKHGGKEGIWKVPVGGGDETEVLEEGIEGRWQLMRESICFLGKVQSQNAIKLFGFETGQIKILEVLGDIQLRDGFTVSPDAHWILYVEGETEGDLMLVENFR